MDKENYSVGIDVGTTKICTVVARRADDTRHEILGVGVAPSVGLRSGIVVDRQATIDSIRQSVLAAEEMSGLTIQAAYVGITGDHTRSANVVGRVHTGPEGEVTPTDVEQVKQSAIDSVSLPVDREIIHSVVRDFSVDGTAGVTRPVGMAGRRLDVLMHVVTGMGTIIENVCQCVEAAGLHVYEHVLEPIATGRTVLTDAERDLGVLLIDIGGGTSDVAVFIDKSICHTAVIPVAGNRVTRDIAEVLRISVDDAEQLKCKFAAALPELVSETDLVQVNKADGLDTDRVPRKLVAEIVNARLIEIFKMVNDEMHHSSVPKIGGVVLSGGGCQAPGTAKLASSIFGDLPVRTSEPRNLTGRADLVTSPIFSTGVGLALIACDNEKPAILTTRRKPVLPSKEKAPSWFADVVARLREYLPW